MNIEYDKQIEVTKPQYDILVHSFGGVIAHREESGRYYIKVWVMQFAKHIESVLKFT